MKPIIQKLSMVMVVLYMSISASAYDFEVDGLYYDIISSSDRTCALTKGDNIYSGIINIPDSVNVKGRFLKVIAIKARTFLDTEYISELTIPQNVINIDGEVFRFGSSIGKLNIPYGETTLEIGGYKAGPYSSSPWESSLYQCNPIEVYIDRPMSSGFSSNTSIKKLTIGKHLDHFRGGLFYYCKNLTWLYIEDGDKPLIFSSKFSGCPLSETYIGRNFDSEFDSSPFKSTAIENITLGANVTTLEKNAFEDCSQLSSVNLGNIQNIGAYAFYKCEKLSTLNFPTSLTSMGPWCFQYCDSIKEINLDCNIETIPKHAFSRCKSLKSVKIAGLVRTIENYAFSGCNKLSSIVIGEGIESIGDNAFSSAAIDYIELPNSLKIIEKEAFYGCKNLKKIIFGTNIEKIGKDAFNSSTYGNSIDVDTIVIRAAVPPSIEETTFSAKTYLNCVVIVPVESESAYKNTDGWKTFWNIEGRDFQSGIDNVIDDDSSISVITEESSIHILHNDDGNIVRVFSIQGTMIAETSENVINNLPKGLYIVTVGTKTFKVSLR